MKRLKKAINRSIILVLVLTLLLPAIVYAQTWEFRFPTSVQDTSGTTRINYPALLGFGGTSLVDAGKINANGLDTNMQIGSSDIQYMISTGQVATVLPNLSAGGLVTTNLYTGYAPAQTSFPIITGEGGYLITPDAGALEPTNAFEIEWDGYVDTDAGDDKFMVYKQQAMGTYISDDTDITAFIGDLTQPIIGGSSDVLNPAAVEYQPLMGGSSAWLANELDVYQTIPTAGDINDLNVRLSAAPGAGDSYTFTVMVNGAPSALAVTISGAADTTGNDIGAVAVVAGDRVSLRSEFVVAPAVVQATWSTTWLPTVVGETINLAHDNTLVGNTTYAEIQGYTAQIIVEANVQAPMPTAGTFSDLYVYLSQSAGVGADAYSVTLRVNGADSALTTTILQPAVDGNDTVNTVAVVAGDLVVIEITPIAIPANQPDVAIGMVFTPTVSRQSLIMGGSSSDQPAANATEYQQFSGTGNSIWNAVEANMYSLNGVYRMSDLYVNLQAAPAGAETYTVSIREAGADTGLTTTITGAATTGNDTAHEYYSSAGAVVDTQMISSAAAALTYIHWGVVATNPISEVTAAGMVSADMTVLVAGGGDGLQIYVDGTLYDTSPLPFTSGNAWVQKAPQLGVESIIYSMAVYNGKLYGGTSPGGNLYEWNDVNLWVQRAPQLGAELRIYSMAVYNGKLYGGTSHNGKLYEWNDVNLWVEVAPQLGAETQIRSMAVYNGKLYGGTNPNGKLYEWNDVNLWVEVAPQLGAESSVFSLAVYNGKLYGGTSPGGNLYEWNDVNLWVQRAPQLGAESSIFSLAVYNGKLYGGTNPNGKLYEWNDVNLWVEVAPQLGVETRIGSMAVYNGKLYGGTNPNGKLYEWNDVNLWVEVAPKLGVVTEINSLAVYNGKLYGGTGDIGNLYEWNRTLTGVPDNSNDWLWNQNDVMPYATSIKEEVAGVATIEYAPDTMVGGTDYVAGTAIFTNASATVTGVATTWDQTMVDGAIKYDADDLWVQILSVESTTSLTLSAVYAGAGGAAAAYTMSTLIPNRDLAGASFARLIWGANTNATVTYGVMVSSDSTTASGIAEAGFEMPTSPLPTTWFASGENVANLPLYDALNGVAIELGMPVQMLYFWYIIGIAFGVALVLMIFTRSALFGVMGMTIVLFIGSSMTIIPMWMPVVILIVDIGIMYLYRQVSY